LVESRSSPRSKTLRKSTALKVNIRINEREMIGGKELLDTPIAKGRIS
jgi:hypothetical protein